MHNISEAFTSCSLDESLDMTIFSEDYSSLDVQDMLVLGDFVQAISNPYQKSGSEILLLQGWEKSCMS
jgi:hypothetical protein